MNRLKEYLQVEVRSAYKYIATALGASMLTEECIIDLGLCETNEIYRNNYDALAITIAEIIEEMEKYLKVEVR